MAELVIGALLYASFDFLLEKVASPYVEDLFFKGKNESSSVVSERLFKLKSTFNSLAAVRFEVENKRIKNPAVEKWLDDLLDAVDDAEDFFGDIEYDAMKPNKDDELKKEKRKAISKLLSCFSKPSTSTDRVRNANMEKILKRLECLANQIGNLNLEKNVVEVQPSGGSRVKTSLPDEPELYGRKTDEDALMKLLMSDEDSSEKICVIPIVGMGGIGKTTLAQTLFNDERVKKKFESRAWVYVSDKFDSTAVTKNLLQELAPSDAGNDMTLNLLQVNLSNKLMGKKFLIVLDDVWEDDYAQWTEVMKPFNGGAKGSKIIVTTRNGKVADIIQTTDTHQLRELSEDECWALFVKHASSGNSRKFTENPNLERIGREISKKCNGLPLAAKVLGGILRSTLDVGRWEQIATNNIWELTHERSEGLPAALEVSYYYLPLHLKRCFAFCSIFPKGYQFQREELVLLWMAENLVMRSKGNRRIEEVAGEYFDDLVSMSFFVKSKEMGRSYFVMHDLLVDLAKIVSGKYSSLLEHNDDIVKFEKKTRRLGCDIKIYTDNKISKCDFEPTHLRTFLTLGPTFLTLGPRYSEISISKEVMQNLLSKFKSLRALSFCGLQMTEFSDSIGDLKHLRYLDLSKTKIVMLPEFVTMLYNLQTLKLKDCDHLQTLPKDMHHLINLRHLIISGSSLVEMPSQISKLTNLQILTTFVVGKDSGAKIEELAELQSLHGELSIKKLENVVNITKTPDQVIVLEKKQLENLRLEWNVNDVVAVVDPKHGEGVLEMLSPNRTLKQLQISRYTGKIFPNWVGNDSFSNIVGVTLYGCEHCSYLPPFGQLLLLKHLSISKCNSVVTVGAEFYGNCTARKPFSSLETLIFNDMSSWEQWNSMQTEEATTYGKLKTLEINDCPKLVVDLPGLLPSLIRIKIKGYPLLSLPRLPRVTEMSVANLENSELLYEAIKPMNPCSTLTPLYHYPPLQHLTLSNCGSSFRSLHMDLFPNLKFLDIASSDYFEAITVSDGKSLEELTSLYIVNCDSFVSFPNGGLIAPKLNYLSIVNCPKLKWLPEKMTSLSSLESLTIDGCPLIKSFPEGGLPVSLSSLCISYGQLLRMKWNWQTLPHLTTLRINGYGIEEDVESFPKEGLLPNTITYLEISSFRRLRGLDKNGLTQLTSLQTLYIRNCRELETLSEEGKEGGSFHGMTQAVLCWC
ncbi:putative disease resistance protein At3g14460 [Cannabis sativa]|uniref:putative disease resistance protein At3g14460 n=1 Tax=Cannabis sativa TaxID=3483 RepID=UPI0029C9F20C|nr:putative disease resistance protein At3g14460 [Cannabis sativa]